MSTSTVRLLLVRIATLTVIVCMAFIALVLVLAFAWGRCQAYTPEYVEHRVAVGMTLEQVAYQLGPIEDFDREQLKGGGYRVLLTEPGLGAWFAPQHEIWLEFGKAGQVRAGYATIVYQISDCEMALRLANKVE